ncbi:MAG TPA: winged helix-turn-helix domain-containing protein [Vicinamibacteria bacterium]|nr:winged helix-turn-helix domain-containing protein [Vicinamibacteria bacterium]HRB12109.1 winged helix-turn-helix domain-containing protein [Vicinamibacteria bacterium]
MTLHSIGPFTLDTRTLLLLREGEIVKVPMKTVEVLLALLSRQGEIATKDELLKAAWPDSIVEEANLTVHVALLRKTLGAAAPIETISKRGYRLLAAPPAPATETAPERQAREAVLRGRYFWNKFTRASLERAASVFEEALRIDSGSGDAHSGLSDTRLMQGLLGFNPDRSVFTAAREHGERAAELAAQSADAQASFAFSRLFDGYDFKGAEAALARARTLAPTRVEPHLWSALFHALHGDTLRALAAAKEATAIDPISLKVVVGSGFHLYLSQQYEPDLDPLLRALELEPEFAVALWALGLACDQLGRFEQAESAHRAAVLHSGSSPAMESNLARSLALAGKRSEAASLLERLRAEGLAPYRVATVETALGENARAIASIERAFALKDPWLVVLKVDPMLDAIRKDRRIVAIQKEVLIG